MGFLQFYTQELPLMGQAGARYVVVACCGRWRDGAVTSDPAKLAALRKQLRKRFMNRLAKSR